jgi:hypothetical protein
MTGVRVLALFALFGTTGALAAIVLLAKPQGSAGSPEPQTLSTLAGDPASLRGRTVTITGAVAERGYLSPADANAALVLTDDAGTRVLVLVTESAHPPRRPRPGTVLQVTGRVIDAPDPARLTDRDGVTPAALLRHTHTVTGIVANDIERADAAAPASRPLRGFSRTAVRDVVQHPRRHDDDLLALTGRAYRPSRFGFVLLQGRHAVFVGASPDLMRSVRSGAHVRVRAELGRMSRFRADTAAGALSGHLEGRSSARNARIRRTPAEPGSPYLILRRIRDASGGST